MSLFTAETQAELAKLLLVESAELEEVCGERGKFYRSRSRRKPNGELRTLYVPHGKLKLIQQKINRQILRLVKLRNCVHGAVLGRSVITNAKPHVGKAIVFSMDIKNFFPSVSSTLVHTIFASLGFRGQAADQLVKLTTWENQLPQGAPTSSSLANLSMSKIDLRLEKLAIKYAFAYTRYIDDLTFSGPVRLKRFRRVIQRVVEDEGFVINPDKSSTMHSGMRQTVTKIVVNRKINLPREERKNIRQSFIQAVRVGEIDNPNVQGRLSWLSSVNPSVGAKIRNLA